MKQLFTMKQLFFLSLFSLATLSSFSGKPPKMPRIKKGSEWVEPVKPAAPINIYGNWNWIETDCCGIRHGISTPESTNDIIELEIKNDNSFLEIHSKSNTLPRNGNYITFRDNFSDMIQFNDERPAQYILSKNGDTLVISWKYLELQTEKYVRKSN